MAEKIDRLFVPLKTEPYEWFQSGKKHWELRQRRGGFRFGAYVGRRVELRRGYSTEDALWGSITDVEVANTIDEMFAKVWYKRVLPTATGRDQAKLLCAKILRVSPEAIMELIAFRVQLDQ